jgi:hypothetical protein
MQVLTDLQYIRKKVPIFYEKLPLLKQRELLERIAHKVAPVVCVRVYARECMYCLTC